jgi:hypothetical protein
MKLDVDLKRRAFKAAIALRLKTLTAFGEVAIEEKLNKEGF